jgi:hypothetical protein
VVNIGPTVDAELTKGPNHVDLRFRTQHACFSVSLTPDTALGLISALMQSIGETQVTFVPDEWATDADTESRWRVWQRLVREMGE